MGRLQGKVALITGTGGGQGRGAALLFAAEGATVVGCDLKTDGASETVDAVRAAGGRMDSTHPLDLTDEAAVRAWVDDAAGRHGRLDVLYNNAGATRFDPIEDESYEDWSFTPRRLHRRTHRIADPHAQRPHRHQRRRHRAGANSPPKAPGTVSASTASARA